jgi:hypothetical protein
VVAMTVFLIDLLHPAPLVALTHVAEALVTSIPAELHVALSGFPGLTGRVLAVKTLPEVIEGLRTWVMGILAAVATLFLVIGGLRYMAAAGDPSQVEQAKGSFRAALTGYALAVLAPVVLQVLQGILGG